MRGMVRGGRLVWLRVSVRDAPGALAEVAQIVGEEDGNIVEINHQRLRLDVAIKLTELDLLVETRGSGHARQLVKTLQLAGYEARILGDISDK